VHAWRSCRAGGFARLQRQQQPPQIKHPPPALLLFDFIFYFLVVDRLPRNTDKRGNSSAAYCSAAHPSLHSSHPPCIAAVRESRYLALTAGDGDGAGAASETLPAFVDAAASIGPVKEVDVRALIEDEKAREASGAGARRR
jgi:hypothetical protein